jgi:hypothetical protein
MYRIHAQLSLHKNVLYKWRNSDALLAQIRVKQIRIKAFNLKLRSAEWSCLFSGNQVPIFCIIWLRKVYWNNRLYIFFRNRKAINQYYGFMADLTNLSIDLMIKE